MIDCAFNYDNIKELIIPDYEYNKEINILNSVNAFMSYPITENLVDFYSCDDDSGRQKWIITKINENYVTIKGLYNRPDLHQYIGKSYNDDNIIRLYLEPCLIKLDVVPNKKFTYSITFML